MELRNNKRTSICKQCGNIYKDDGALCPSCTDHYNAVYNRSNLVGHQHNRFVSQTTNTVMLFACTIGASIGLILVLGILQAFLPVVWSFYYIAVGICIGHLIRKYESLSPLFSVIYALTITAITFYLADVLSIGLSNHIDWLRFNDYTPSIWKLALNFWKIRENGSGFLSVIFKSLGLFEAWRQSRIRN